ncbi:MAG: aminotransferase class I/II-fold pyridoxal phosphate-dependent enzyme [Proteobacteria bacterium]|nr:aminotransferase class I/II-fold pyridoxal phosphate-dependent enzyme [Pseudomonadota bacterium]
MIKINKFNESMIRKMTVLAKKYDAINLAQGYPEHTSRYVIDAAVEAIVEDKNQYTVTYGLKELREKLSAKIGKEKGIDIDYNDLIITCGASEGIMDAILGNLPRHGKVVIFEPVYENYIPAVEMAGGEIATVSIEGGDLDLEHFSKILRKGDFIIINTPHNPTGKVFTEEELTFIARKAKEMDCVIITDETYEYLTYEKKHISIASIDGMSERTITVGSFSKTYSVTGWRLGYIYGEGLLMQNIKSVHDYMTICAPTPFQYAALKLLDLPESYYSEFVESYRKRRDFMVDQLRDCGFHFTVPDGAYYVFAKLPDEIKENDVEFCFNLVEKGGVALVPGSSFYYEKGENRYVRFSFSKDMESIVEAMKRLKSYLGT